MDRNRGGRLRESQRLTLEVGGGRLEHTCQRSRMNPKETPKTKVFGESGVRLQGPLVTPRVLPEASQPRQSRSLSGSQEPPNLEDELHRQKPTSKDKSPSRRSNPHQSPSPPTSLFKVGRGVERRQPPFLEQPLASEEQATDALGKGGG